MNVDYDLRSDWSCEASTDQEDGRGPSEVYWHSRDIDQFVAAHRRAWARPAAPGEWWTGAVRLAIAEETRAATHCRLCRDRKAALSPYAVTGTHTAATDLPEIVIDVIHRIRTDSGRLTRQFYDGALAGGLSDAEYVETVGGMATVIAIDSFCDALGMPRHALPAPPRPPPAFPHHRSQRTTSSRCLLPPFRPRRGWTSSGRG